MVTQENVDDLRAQIDVLETSKNNYKGELEIIKKDLKDSKKEYKDAEKELSDILEDVEGMKKIQKDSEQRLKIVQDEVRDKENELDSTNDVLQQKAIAVDAAEEWIENIKKEAEKITTNTDKQVGAAKKELGDLCDKIKELL